jgi:DNA-binding HxlR family transcriptional regulator
LTLLLSLCYLVTQGKFIISAGHSGHQGTPTLPRDNVRKCRPEICSIINGVKQYGSVWQLVVVAYLLDGPLRFNELLKMGGDEGLNSRTLSRTLRHLVANGLVGRTLIDAQPLAVRYSLTPHGKELRGLLAAYQELAPTTPRNRLKTGPHTGTSGGNRPESAPIAKISGRF